MFASLSIQVEIGRNSGEAIGISEQLGTEYNTYILYKYNKI